MWRCNTDTFTHGRFFRRSYAEALSHTGASTHTDAFYTQKLCTQKLFTHTHAFTHRRFYARTLLQQSFYTRKSFYTQTHLHRDAFTVHTDESTHRRLYTDVLYTQTPFTQMLLHGRTLLHTDAVAHRVDTQTLWRNKACRKYVTQGARGGERASSTTSYYKACRKYLPLLLCTTKLARKLMLAKRATGQEKQRRTLDIMLAKQAAG